MRAAIKLVFGGAGFCLGLGQVSLAADLEVIHWWTQGAEAAAAQVLADSVNSSGDHWIDNSQPGSSSSRDVAISRILGGDPMEAVLMAPGPHVDDLIASGLLLDLTDLANQQGWDDVVSRQALAHCVHEDRVYCVPVAMHSEQWMWINRHVYENNGIPVPSDWNEFVATAPQLKDRGIIPLAASGTWGIELLLRNIELAIGGVGTLNRIYRDRDVSAVTETNEMRAVFEAMDDARNLVDEGYGSRQWNEATAMVVEGQAAAQVMGDWAQGEFVMAGQTPGIDYSCLAGLGLYAGLSPSVEAFYFPVQNDPETTSAQLRMAATLMDPGVQMAFSAKKGSMPTRRDIDASQANACLRAALGKDECPKPVGPSGFDNEFDALRLAFFEDHSMSVDDLQRAFAQLVEAGDFAVAGGFQGAVNADDDDCCDNPSGTCPQ